MPSKEDAVLVLVVGAGHAGKQLDQYHEISKIVVDSGIADSFKRVVRDLEALHRTMSLIEIKPEILQLSTSTIIEPPDKIPVPKSYKRNRHKM